MGAILSVPTQPLYVTWGCRRCGHTGGLAKTTMPVVDDSWTEGMMRDFLDSLRTKLQRKHQEQGCIAAHGDFTIERYYPQDRTILDGDMTVTVH